MEMKSIHSFIPMLDESIVHRFLRACEGQNILYSSGPTLLDAINTFRWSSTVEGEAFWDKVYHDIYNGGDRFLAKPKPKYPVSPLSPYTHSTKDEIYSKVKEKVGESITKFDLTLRAVSYLPNTNKIPVVNAYKEPLSTYVDNGFIEFKNYDPRNNNFKVMIDGATIYFILKKKFGSPKEYPPEIEMYRI